MPTNEKKCTPMSLEMEMNGSASHQKRGGEEIAQHQQLQLGKTINLWEDRKPSAGNGTNQMIAV